MTRLADTPETLSPADRAPLSLLYPRGARQAPPSGVGLDEADLGLVIVVRTLDWDGRHSRFVSNVLAELNTDHATIAYRQDVLADLLALPALATAIGDVLPQLGELAGMGRSRSWGERVPLLEVAGRLAELDAYVSCVERLGDALERRTTTDERPLTNDQRPTTNDQRPTTTNQLPQFSILGSAGLLALRDRVAAARPSYRRCVPRSIGLAA
jgi:hypothetical protein